MEMIWILIPLAGIALGGFEQWLKFKKEQQQLGNTTHQLEGSMEDVTGRLEASEAERRRLQERIENLETIVTSRLWSAAAETAPQRATPPLPKATPTRPPADSEQRRRLADLEMTLAELPKDDEPSAEQKAARLAQELNP